MQITRERVVGEIAKLTAERDNHLAHIEQIAANVHCVDGCLIECRAMLAILDAPEPETPATCPEPAPVIGDRAAETPVMRDVPLYLQDLQPTPAPEMLPVEIPAEADDLSLVERAPHYCTSHGEDGCNEPGLLHCANCPLDAH